jgi:cytochrome c oxidase subunit 4
MIFTASKHYHRIFPADGGDPSERESRRVASPVPTQNYSPLCVKGKSKMGCGLLNLGSLLLGLIAWIIPVVNLVKNNNTEQKNRTIFSLSSMSACAISLCLQIFYQNHLVKIEDWSALMDTSNAVALVSSILLVGTIALNAITLFVYRKGR